MSRLLRLVFAACACSAAAAPARAAAQDYSYAFRVTSDDGKPWGGSVRVAGDRVRIDAEQRDHHGRDHRGPGRQDYLLVTDGGRTVTVVDPEEESYSVGRAEAFEQIVATAMRAVNVAVSTNLSDVRISTERLGASDTIAGLPTHRFRLTQEYTSAVGVMGYKGDPEYHVVITDYWVAPSMKLARNPLVEMLSTAETALAQTDQQFVAKSAAARNALFTGMPLRLIVAARSTGEKGKHGDGDRLTVEVTKVVRGPVDRSALEVPRGYRRSENGLKWSFDM